MKDPGAVVGATGSTAPTGPVLVTGGSGLLGHALRPLLPHAVFLSGSDYDLRDRSEAMAAFRTYRPSAVLHLAARVGGVKENAAHNLDFLVENLQVNVNVLDAAATHGVRRLVTCLSSCCYPFFPDRATGEDDLHGGMPYDGNLGYGYAKRALEVQVRLANRQLGVRWQAVTPVTMYGPHDNFDLEDGHVVGALVAKACAAADSDGELVVWGDGSAVRQFVYASDVARVLEALLGQDDTDGLIIAPDAGVSIRELAETVASAAGARRVRFDAAQPAGVAKKELSGARLRARFPEFRFTPLAEGLRETMAWYRARPRDTEEVHA